MLREEKGGLLDRRTSWQKWARGSGLQGTTETWGVEIVARQQVQDGRWRPAGMSTCLDRRSKTVMREYNWLQRTVHISLRVANGGGGQDTEGEGGGSRE